MLLRSSTDRVVPCQPASAYRSEISRCDAGFEAAKARQDEPAAFYWSLQRSAAVRLLGLVPGTQQDLVA